MGHDHSHGHSHDHSETNRTRLAWALGITASILVAEVIGAITTNSLALLVDAAHMLTDTAGLLMALTAANLIMRKPTTKRTWGFRRAEVLSATLQSALLLAVGIYAAVDAIQRLFDPPEVQPTGLLVFGIIGLAGNIASMLIIAGGRGHNLNMRAAFLEVVNDALGSVAVIVAAVVIALTGWMRADSVAALLISALIVPRAVALLKETTHILLESTPRGLDLNAVRTHLEGQAGVLAVHDLHASQIASNLPVLTAHVVVKDEMFDADAAGGLLRNLQQCVAAHFEVSIEHSTFQIEPESHQRTEHHPDC
ncbi:cation diffusion facilitator family transporter [Glutamicibacter protophormiae]|uniref:cation diffusion facilitator family transporter n=1 Tax=Glutamicibacter protophormiae TaxID=37930 RepID=UPI002A805E1C|nr:cation diffusion facilitator family transporter [Glutamicibacter protophormiae]WPR65356.1 cation diffusion facilitator family transporter [Glutamicibacter protophormiae]WPR68853.1 cation diffusion facilitator family transporter [Glutamicibacter protophormiae]